MPFIADTFNEVPGAGAVTPRGVFAESAETARKVAEAGFRRRHENLTLLLAQADRLVERDFTLFDQFVEQLRPLGLVAGVEYGDFAMPRDPYGTITRPVVIRLSETSNSYGQRIVLNACYIGTGLTHFEVRHGLGMICVGGVEVSQVQPRELKDTLIGLAGALADKAVRRKFNSERDKPDGGMTRSGG